MSERFSGVEGKLGRKRGLEERLRDQPELRAKLESLLDVVENAAGDVEKAAEAERRVTEELRQMGNEALHAWARRQGDRKEDESAGKPGLQRKVKKNVYWQTRYGEIEVVEQVFRQGRTGPEISPFLYFGGGRVPGMLGTAAASYCRFRSRCSGGADSGETEGALWD
jgi:hypothetical protein